jgi:hypothetical protein
MYHSTNTKNFPSMTQGVVHRGPQDWSVYAYANTPANELKSVAQRINTASASVMKADGNVVFQGQAAKVFEPYPIGGTNAIRKRIGGEMVSGHNQVRILQSQRIGNDLVVTKAERVPLEGWDAFNARMASTLHNYGPDGVAAIGTVSYGAYKAATGDASKQTKAPQTGSNQVAPINTFEIVRQQSP